MLTNSYPLAQPPYDLRFPDHFFVRSHQIRHPCDTTLLPTLFPKNISNFFPYSPVFTTSIKSALNQRSRPALPDSLATHSPCPAHHPTNHSSPIFPSHQNRPHQNRSPPLTPEQLTLNPLFMSRPAWLTSFKVSGILKLIFYWPHTRLFQTNRACETFLRIFFALSL